MSRQTGDMDAIRHFVSYVVYAFYENMLLFILALVMIFTVDVRLALCMLIVVPFTLLTTLSQSRAVKPAFHKIRRQFSSLNAFVQENISGNRVVKAFAKEDYEMEKFGTENDAYRDAELGASRVWMKYVPVFEFLSNALTIILILLGGYMVINGDISMGKLVTVNGYLWMLTNPLRQIGWLVNDIQPVSYTHLDVYKRQVKWLWSEKPVCMAVSTGGTPDSSSFFASPMRTVSR